MRIFSILSLVFFLQSNSAFALADTTAPKYNIHFVKNKPDTVKSGESLREFKIETSDISDDKLKDYFVKVSVDEKNSSFKRYEIKATIDGKKFSELKSLKDLSIIIKIKDEDKV